MSPPAPIVTVIIAAWQAEATLARAIASVQAQSLPVEIIVIDDASEDGTAALAEAMARDDARLHVLRQPVNQGPAAARNRALDTARAPWVTVLDADDFMDPDRLEHLFAMATAQDLDFLADDLFKVAEDNITGPRTRLWSEQDFGALAIDAAGFIRGNLSTRHGGRREMGFVKPLMRLDFLNHHGLRYGDMRLGEDYDLYARALILGARFQLVDPMGYVAVVRPGSLSGAHATSAHLALMQADRRMLAMPQLKAETRTALRAHLLEEHKKWAWRRMIDAVKARHPGRALACFAAPPAVGADLIRRLSEQVWLRGTRRLRGG